MRAGSIRAALVAVLGVALAPCASARAAEATSAPKAPVAAIPGVVAADARWELLTTTDAGADGLVPMKDGSILFAQERTNLIWRVAGHEATRWNTDSRNAGTLGVDAKGQVWAVARSCTDPLRKGPPCTVPPMIAIEGPGTQFKMVVNKLFDGKDLPRPSDLALDNKGGAYISAAAAPPEGIIYYVTPSGGTIEIDGRDFHSNGVIVSPDGRTLYASADGKAIYAYDIQPDGSVKNRRTFGRFDDTNADGMAVDGAGRVYETGAHGIHVFDKDGNTLGIIPTATGRRPSTLCFGGKDKKFLYMVENGVTGPDGKPLEGPEMRTIYRLPVLAQGYLGRAK